MEKHLMATKIVDIFKPALKRKYKNGKWVYETTFGDKSEMGLSDIVVQVIKDL